MHRRLFEGGLTPGLSRLLSISSSVGTRYGSLTSAGCSYLADLKLILHTYLGTWLIWECFPNSANLLSMYSSFNSMPVASQHAVI